MPLTCIAVDDEPLALQLISEFVKRLNEVVLLDTFDNAIAAESFLKKHTVDLLFMDVDMPDLNGITLIKRLPIKPLLILTTAYRNYAYDGFELSAVDFLLKPFDFQRFSKAVDKAIQQCKREQEEKDNFISVYAEYKLIKINISEIEFIAAMEDYVQIHLLNGKTILTLSTLKGMMQRLPKEHFLQVHRSFIIALRHIQSFSNKKVKLLTTTINVGLRYLDEVSQKLKR